MTACTEPPEEYGETQQAASVGSFIDDSCTTAVVRGLSRQIAEEVDCMAPASLSRLAPSTKIRFTSNAVLPYMHPRAKADLLDVSGTIKINSAYRTVAQQYLLYRWWKAGRCGITAAATPGRSNHESGRAVDLANWAVRRASMEAHRWDHSVPGDPVHFDNTRSPDNRGKDVRAFQRLWNRNRPNDKITVDGKYGPQTARRLRRAPAKGFKRGAFCKQAAATVEVGAIAGLDRVAPGAAVHYAFTVTNHHDYELPASTRIVVADGLPSDLYDPATWVSPTEVGTIGVSIPPGGDAIIDLEVLAPTVIEETAAAAQFKLVDGVADVGILDLALTVTPHGDHGISGDVDAHDHGDPGDAELADEDGVIPEDGGGCSTSGGHGLALGFLAFVALLMRGRHRPLGDRRGT